MPRKWLSSADYRSIVDAVKAARVEAGVSQRELAQRLGKHPSFVNKIELLERRIDVLEFIAVARALGLKPAALLEKADAELPNQIQL